MKRFSLTLDMLSVPARTGLCSAHISYLLARVVKYFDNARREHLRVSRRGLLVSSVSSNLSWMKSLMYLELIQLFRG